MTDQRPTENDLEEPEMIRDDAGERSDGRPTFEIDGPGEPAYEAPGDAPTAAPEEQGKEPSTEHAPGASL
ncbi:hypothetical protein BH20CHL7_BH20CHL7_00730 [soil metagenome]